MPLYLDSGFRRNAVQPIICLKTGWGIIKNQYWLFMGIAVVGLLVGSAAPFGILMGPMMCGIYLTLFKQHRDEPVEFGMLFKGFDYFGESIIATLCHLVPGIIVMVPFYLVFYGGIFFLMPEHGAPAPRVLYSFFGVLIVVGLMMSLLILLLAILFAFTYPLIVERQLSGIEAVKLSLKAGLGNFWPLLGLIALNWLLGFAGMLLCFVGAYLTLPVSFAALAVAYEQVFDLRSVDSSLTLPPPPTF
jgi:hypothetical protein